MTVLTQSEAQHLATEFRGKFRNSDAFTAAWEALFGLKTTITPTLARRILGEELQRYRAHVAGLVEPAYESQPSHVSRSDLPPDTRRYQCPGCHADLCVWQRDGHALDCEHIGCYELEIKLRVAVARREAQRAERTAKEQDAMLDIERD